MVGDGIPVDCGHRSGISWIQQLLSGEGEGRPALDILYVHVTALRTGVRFLSTEYR